ncbi:MAG: hypothetical protein ACK5O1_07065 [Holosporales bacterium]
MLAFLSSPITMTKPIAPINHQASKPHNKKSKQKTPNTHHENQEEQMKNTAKTDVVA